MCPENSDDPVRNLPKLVTLTPNPHPKQASRSFSPKESITPKARTFAFPESSGASFVQMPFLVVDNFLCPSVTVLCTVPVVPRMFQGSQRWALCKQKGAQQETQNTIGEEMMMHRGKKSQKGPESPKGQRILVLGIKQ